MSSDYETTDSEGSFGADEVALLVEGLAMGTADLEAAEDYARARGELTDSEVAAVPSISARRHCHGGLRVTTSTKSW